MFTILKYTLNDKLNNQFLNDCERKSNLTKKYKIFNTK